MAEGFFGMPYGRNLRKSISKFLKNVTWFKRFLFGFLNNYLR